MSDEVEIVCLSDSAVIPDLGLTMARGSRMSVSFAAASRSRDLELAKSSGIVGVRPIRAAVVRTNVNQPPHRQADAEKNLLAVQRAAYPAPPPPRAVDTSTLEQAIRDLTTEVRQLRHDLHAQQQAPAPVDMTPVVEALKGALSGLSLVIPSGTSSATKAAAFHATADEERFIPSGIVPTNLKADISPNTTNEGSGSLEDAQAALREARRRARET